MRFQVDIDSYTHQCDSTDPELLGRWLIEIFGRHQWSAGTFCRVRAYPSCGDLAPGGTSEQRDWIADTRYMDTWAPTSPRELLDKMGKTLDRYEADKAEGLI